MGGEFEYTVPYTGNYQITLSGSQGSAYSDSSGGYGYTLTKNVRLNCGDVLKFSVPKKPTGTSTNGSVLSVAGGNAARYWLNDSLQLLAGSGSGYVNNNIAPNGILSVKTLGGEGNSVGVSKTYNVHWHSGNGKSGATHSNSFPTMYSTSNPGGCYRDGGHTHDATSECPKHHEHESACYSSCGCTSGNTGNGAGSPCSVCCHSGGHSNPCTHRELTHCTHSLNTFDCGAYTNTWVIGCGYQHGQIVGISNGACAPGSCWGECDTQVVGNRGDAKFTVKLLEQSNLYYNRKTAPAYWDGVKCNLVIKDSVVVWFKRP